MEPASVSTHSESAHLKLNGMLTLPALDPALGAKGEVLGGFSLVEGI